MVVTDQAHDRCPHCGALLHAGAQWCTLCYADLRPEPEPEPEPVAVPVREPSYAPGAAGAPIDPLTAPLSALDAAAQALAAHTADREAPPSTVSRGWPCSGCQTVVPFDEDVCATCGTRFLDGARGEPDLLDRIGPGGLPVSTQTLIIGGGAAAIIAIIVASMYLIGLFL